MSTPHKATPDEWEKLRRWAEEQSSPLHYRVLLEVADRVAAMEEASSDMTPHKATERRRRFASVAFCGDREYAICEEGRLWYNSYNPGGCPWVEFSALPEIEDPAGPADHSRGAPEMVATDEELLNAFHGNCIGGAPRLRAVYNLGRQHAAQVHQEREVVPVLWVQKKPGPGCNASVIAWLPSVGDLPIGEYILYAFPGAAQPRQEVEPTPPPAPVIPGCGSTSKAVGFAAAPLLWVLWHHLGASSPVGQPIRRYLGMGQHDRMTPEGIEAAKRWARESMGVQDYLDSIPAYSSTAPEPAPPPTPDGGLLEEVARLLANRISLMRPSADCTPLACAALCVVADAAEKMVPDPNLTWERVAIWLDMESKLEGRADG